MPHRLLGRSGVSVSELCLGSMLFGGPTGEEEASRIIAHAAEQGINFIDTADVYQAGRSEEIVGRAIKARRDHWVLATKVAQPTGARGQNDRGLSRLYVTRALEASLMRLGTDRIDLYYIHRVDPRLPFEELVATFGELIGAGKIRYWALSNVRAWQIAEIVHLCRAAGVPQPMAVQPLYNLMNRQPEVELIPAARHLGLGVVPYSPIARGVLAGKYRPNVAPPADSRAGRRDKRMLESEWRPESLALADTLRTHAERRGVGLAQWATRWVLNNAGVSAAIAGPRTFEQWQGYLAALDCAWTPEDEALADRLVPPGHPSTPGFTDPEYPVEGRFARVARG